MGTALFSLDAASTGLPELPRALHLIKLSYSFLVHTRNDAGLNQTCSSVRANHIDN